MKSSIFKYFSRFKNDLKADFGIFLGRNLSKGMVGSYWVIVFLCDHMASQYI